jgi:deferrochelatase/peroxidase EfeB
MTTQSFINVVIPFASALADDVDLAIDALRNPACGNRPAAAAERQLGCVQSLHFMSITVVRPICPAETGGSPPRKHRQDKHAHLLLELTADAGPAAVFGALANVFGNELASILGAAKIATGAGLAKVLLKHHVVISDGWSFWKRRRALGQVFSGSPGMSAWRIRRERELEKVLAGEVAALCGSPLSAREKLEFVRNKLWSDPQADWKWAFVPEPAPLLGAAPDASFAIFNPQIRKAAFSIIGKLLWPVYVPLGLYMLWRVIDLWAYDGVAAALAWLWPVLWTLFTVFAAIFYAATVRLRYLERTDTVEDTTPSLHHGKELLAVENFSEQNHLASVSRLKSGWLRALALRLAFLVVGTGRFVCAPGFLGKNGVIHFARWMRLPGTDQLLFWSNYDGTWESYVADFIADAPTGVTAIWSNCVGFPRTRVLFGGGAADRDRLVMWARRQQHPTRFWYSAYPGLTAARVRINAAVRQGFASAETFQDCQDWLSLFGSAPRPVGSLQVEQITTVAFGGLSRLRWSTCLGFALRRDDETANKDFIAAIRRHVSYGEALYEDPSAMVLGLSARGLSRLGLPQDAVETFPVAFKQGMWEPSRARLLKDTDRHAPEHWAWGGPASQVDVFLCVYAADQPRLRALVAEVLLAARRRRIRRRLKQPLTPVPRSAVLATEPFGFTDGVSQPIIRGAPGRHQRKEKDIHVVEAGEFIYGYPDNIGVIPPGPSVAASLDPRHLLPDAEANPFRTRPEFSSYEGQGRRDLGMNGTYLVVRQLEQDVGAFDQWFEKEAVKQLTEHVSVLGPESDVRVQFVGSTALTSLNAQSAHATGGARVLTRAQRPYLREALRAKMMGRWSDGASLVRQSQPAAPGKARQPDNEFLFGAEDPAGLGCPFGAHVRRANPRETRYPGSREEIASANRHRLLRVGRVYGEREPDPHPDANADADATGHERAPDTRLPLRRDRPRGLMFMCLNIDIERQFEFVQRTWILNPSIHGLQDEGDPILGHGAKRRFTIPTSSGPVCLGNLPEFTCVRGGGYFFVPGKTLLALLAAPVASPAGTPAAAVAPPDPEPDPGPGERAIELPELA